MFITKKRIIKITSVILLFIAYFIYRNYINLENENSELNKSSYCFYDKWLLNFSFSLNKYASQNLYFRDFMLILASNSLDILMINFIFYFIIDGGCKRTIVSLSIFYLFRGIIQNLFLFSYYHNYLFDQPGFFSIIVPFFRAADFFYSGHCGLAFILTMTFKDANEVNLYRFGVIVTLFQIIVMTSITRAHYSIDVIFGIIAAHYFYIISGKYFSN